MANCLRCLHSKLMFFSNDIRIGGYEPSDYCFCEGHFQTPILYADMTNFICPTEEYPQERNPHPEPVPEPAEEEERHRQETRTDGLHTRGQQAIENHRLEPARTLLRDGFRNIINPEIWERGAQVYQENNAERVQPTATEDTGDGDLC